LQLRAVHDHADIAARLQHSIFLHIVQKLHRAIIFCKQTNLLGDGSAVVSKVVNRCARLTERYNIFIVNGRMFSEGSGNPISSTASLTGERLSYVNLL